MKGESYDGMWSDDMFDGYGKHSTLSFIYEGYFKSGKRHGRGVLRQKDGEIYEGYWFED